MSTERSSNKENYYLGLRLGSKILNRMRIETKKIFNRRSSLSESCSRKIKASKIGERLSRVVYSYVQISN